MLKLDRATREELVDLLAPLMGGEADRRALLSLAFGGHPNLLHQVETAGPVQTFVLNLIVKLADYGDIERGKPALWTLLEAARKGMGVDRQARVDALRPVFNQPTEQVMEESGKRSKASKGSNSAQIPPFYSLEDKRFKGLVRRLIESDEATENCEAVSFQHDLHYGIDLVVNRIV